MYDVKIFIKSGITMYPLFLKFHSTYEYKNLFLSRPNRDKEVGSTNILRIKQIKRFVFLLLLLCLFTEMLKDGDAVNLNSAAHLRRNICTPLVLPLNFHCCCKTASLCYYKYCCFLLLSPLICLCACLLLLEGFSSSLWEAVTAAQQYTSIGVSIHTPPPIKAY